LTTEEVLRKLCAAPGVVGEEFVASEAAAHILREYTDDVTVDAFGNVIAHLPGAAAEAPRILLDAHIDQIGMIVTQIEENGFLRVSNCGGVDRRLVLGQQVTVLGKQALPGIVAAKPPHLSDDEERKKVPEISEIAIDTGYSREELENLVMPGDRVALTGDFTMLQNGRATSVSLDDRSGAAAILHAVKLLAGKPLPYAVTVLFSAQEETSGLGAVVAAFREQPEEAIAVDVSFALQEGLKDRYPKMGSGAMIGIAPPLNRGMFEELVAVAKERAIPFTIEAMGGRTSTNADGIAVSRGGVRAGLISLPLKYMHTPVEVVQLTDVEAVGELIAAYILR
jgi:putative aminopeptidase FrvX